MNIIIGIVIGLIALTGTAVVTWACAWLIDRAIYTITLIICKWYRIKKKKIVAINFDDVVLSKREYDYLKRKGKK